MLNNSGDSQAILPRSKWWWIGLGLLLLLAAWLYVRGYNVSLPFIEHHDEVHHLLAAQHTIDFGHARGVFHEAYPPGMKTVNYLLLKHIKPVDAHHGTMLPALRLITISAWMLVVVLIALLGAMMVHPLTGLMAAAIWIVNPWVVQRAHFTLPDGYLTLFTLLALWLALVGSLQGRRSFSTAAVYSIMLAIVFKTQALFVAPIVLLLPLLNWWRLPARRKDTWQQLFWNWVRFAVFLFWLLLIYPTLEADQVIYFPMSYSSISFPSLESAWASLRNVLRTFQSLDSWLLVAMAGGLLWPYRQRVNAIALVTVVLAGLAWLLGMSMFNVQSLRHYFALGAMLALLYACGLTGLLFVGQEALSRLKLPPLPPRLRELLARAAIGILLVAALLPSYRESDALAHNFTLHDRRNDLMEYMDTSLPPGKYITDREADRTIGYSGWGKYLTDREWGNHKTFNRAWGGYSGVHDFPVAQEVYNLLDKPLETWRAHGALYAIVPHAPMLEDPDIYYPEETVLLKTYPVSSDFRGPDMVVLRLYPMQHAHEGQLGSIRLLGYDINGTVLAAGEAIVLRHYWQAEQPTKTAHHVFNHLLDEAGEIVTQVDYVPLWDARRDTTLWDDPEEILLGREFVLKLPPDLPLGVYQLVSGLYDPDTWQRLRSPEGGDYLSIAEITVTEAES